MSIFEKLTAPFDDNQIEWRIADLRQATRDAETVIVPYLQAAAIRARLDAVLGNENWASDIEHMPNGMICRLSIKINGEWVMKTDCAQDTDQFPSMGASTRAFVRAASVWGIGRYLNELPEFFANYVVEGTPGARPVYYGDKAFHHLPPSISKPTPVAKTKEVPRPKFDNAPLGTKTQVDAIKPQGKKSATSISYIPNTVTAKVKSSQGPVVRTSGHDSTLPDATSRPFNDEKMRSCITKGKKFKDHTLGELENLVHFFTVDCPFPTKGTTIEDKQRLTQYLGGKLEIPSQELVTAES